MNMTLNINKIEPVNTYGLYQTEMLRKPDVIKITGLSNTSLFERTKEGLFPSSVSLGGRSVGFINTEVYAVVNARAAGHTDDQIRHLVKLMTAKRKESANDFLASLIA
jgi:prophage regulatory protein